MTLDTIGKATIVLNMFKTVVAHHGAVTILFVFVRQSQLILRNRVAVIQVFVVFREES